MTVIEVTSLSRANDLALVALADLASAAADANLDHRIIGGQMVTLHLHLAGVQGQVPERDTADADAGVPRSITHLDELAALVTALTGRGYEQIRGDRFERLADGAIIDLLVPSYTSRRRHNVVVGPLIATEAGGLTYALAQTPTVVTVAATLTDGTAHGPIEVRLPSLRAAIAIKAHAWKDRRVDSDALDLARLLYAADMTGLGPDDFTGSVALRDASEIVRGAFRLASGAGTTAAYRDPTDRAGLAALCLRVFG